MPVADGRFRAPAPPRPSDAADGVLVVDKPAGPTSHDVVAKIRHHFKFKKVGHGGTLDPRATGVLIVLLGKGTKLSNRFLGSDKSYEGTLHLGVTTDSLDADGEVLDEKDAGHITREMLEEAMQAYRGDQMQMPPMVSAIKVKGVPLYKHARKGKEIERSPRLIHVYEFSLKRFTPPRADFLVRCTKGTYVRSLCADVGKDLGCGAHLAELRRTGSGDITIDDATSLDTVLGLSRQELLERILPMERFLK